MSIDTEQYSRIEQIYEEFKTEYYSGKYASVHEALEKIAEKSPHSMERFVILYSPPRINPRLMLIGTNPSFFHHDRKAPTSHNSKLTLAEHNLNEVAECIPKVNSYINHEHKFGIALRNIFADVGKPHWLNEAVGFNAFFLQTGGGGLDELKKLSDRAQFNKIQALCSELSKELISLLQPKIVIFIGSSAKNKFSKREFPRRFDPTGTSFLDVSHPANRRGGWRLTSHELKVWLEENEGASSL